LVISLLQQANQHQKRKVQWSNPPCFINATSDRSLSPIMITLTKRIIVLLFVSTLLVIVGVGCNTAHGFGKDMQKAGEGIQNGTD
jgi:predicted small secreted protein